MDIIDPHLHLFDLKKGQYDWLKPENPPCWPDKSIISRDFTEGDLQLKRPLSLRGFVHIEAGFDNIEPHREIAWLEQHCTGQFRSIAFLDITLEKSAFNAQLTRLNTFRSVVGIRHILDADADAILSQPSVIDNLRTLAEFQLIFELQYPIADIKAHKMVISTLKKVPNLKVTLNHLGFFPFESNNDNYLSNKQKLLQLAQFENLTVKCSGWEMLDRHYHIQQVIDRIELAIACFGDHRVMLASNFPLCRFTTSYETYWQELVAQLGATKKALFYDNALTWYQIKSL